MAVTAVDTDDAVDVSGGTDLDAGVYEVTLSIDTTDLDAASPSDFIVGVLKCDDAVGGGGTGPASIIDGIPIAVWGVKRVYVDSSVNDRIWFMRSDQTPKPCLVFVNKIQEQL